MSWIDDWNPEDETFWQTKGRAIARRNLIWSIVAENLGFSVWLLWSVTAANLPKVGFPYSTAQLFQLVALPGLVGALLRFPYTFAVPRFGGRNWTAVSALLLFVPTLLLAFFVSRPTTPFWAMSLAACTAGLGGGNFASSMANISFFYPDKEKGLALGLNAAGGNVGVSVVQLLVPILITVPIFGRLAGGGASHLYLANAGLVWLPFLAVAAVGALLYMDNLSSAKSTFADQLGIVRRKHTWILSWLYVGTFGSFIGYSAAFPLLLKSQFPTVPVTIVFLGPLVGAIARPLGGHLADKIGGTRVTLASFLVMALATLGALGFLRTHVAAGFLAMFFVLFVVTGVGNGSTFRMIPVVFRRIHLEEAGPGAAGEARALVLARRDSAAVLGFTSAVGALGGFFIPSAFGSSIRATGGPGTALGCFLAFYATCLGLTWWCYARRAPTASTPAAHAEAEVRV